MSILSALVLASISHGPVSEPASQPASSRFQELDATLTPALQEVVDRFRLPGLAIGILEKGEVAYLRGFGVARRGEERKVTPRSIFHMASVSKPFVATAIMTLVEAGKLGLDDTLALHLPYFRMADERFADITIRQVLQHRSGMPDVRDYGWDRPEYDEGAAERFVRGLEGERLLFAPGTGERYSNMAFDVLGDLIAKVSGISFEDYVAGAILEPLGMKSSSFQPSHTPESDRTSGHSDFYGPRVDQAPAAHYPYNRRHAPSSTLNSSVQDMLAWLRFNIGRGEGFDVLGSASFDELFGSSDGKQRGLSWFATPGGGNRALYHSGMDVGYTSQVYFEPASGFGIVIAANVDGAPLQEINTLCARAMAGEALSVPAPGIAIPVAAVLESEGVEAAIEAYAELSESPIGYRRAFDELDGVGWLLLRAERFEEAAHLLAFNSAEYYDVADGLVSLAEAMLGLDDEEEARGLLELALEMEPENDRARELSERMSRGG